MAKNLVQDIKINVSKSRFFPDLKIKKKDEKKKSGIYISEEIIEKEKIYNNSPQKPFFAIWVIAGVSIITLFVAVSYFFSSAKITIVSKNTTVNLDNTAFSVLAKSSDDALTFEIVSLP